MPMQFPMHPERNSVTPDTPEIAKERSTAVVKVATQELLNKLFVQTKELEAGSTMEAQTSVERKDVLQAMQFDRLQYPIGANRHRDQVL